MNEEAVQVLKEAMEAPAWWTNRGRLTAREVMRRLEELGYTVARSADVRSEPARASRSGVLAGLMADLESNIAAVHNSRRSERSQVAAESESPLTDDQRQSA
jgi:hypothetical protein